MMPRKSYRSRGEGHIGPRRAQDGRIPVELKVDGQRYRGYARTKEDAREVLQKLQERAGLRTEGDGTLTAFGHRWLRWSKRSLGNSTYLHYESRWRLRVVPYLGDLTLATLEPMDILDWHEDMETDTDDGGEPLWTPSQMNKAHVVLRAALGKAVEWRMVNANPAAAVKPPPARRQSPPPLKMDELARFFEASRTDVHYPVWLTTALLGLREGEVLGLEHKYLDLAAAEVTTVHQPQRVLGPDGRRQWKLVKLKTARSQEPEPRPIPRPLVPVLEEHLQRQAFARRRAGAMWEDYGLVFPTTRGRPIDQKSLIEEFYAVCERVGITYGRKHRGVVFHSLRHSTGSLLTELDVPLPVVMAILRHASQEMARLYTRTASPVHRAATEKLASRLGLPEAQ